MANTRARAKELGESFYFTGKPCKHGHVAKRKTSNGGCYECHLIAHRLRQKETNYASSYKWKAKNPERVKAHKKKEYKNNKETYLEKAAEWSATNPDKRKEIRNNWATSNRPYYAMVRRERYAKQKKASPEWANRQYVLDVYTGCKELNEILQNAGLSTKLTVDHIVPISSDEVCGLHCEFNLQLLTFEDNSAKNNKHIENQYQYGT